MGESGRWENMGESGGWENMRGCGRWENMGADGENGRTWENMRKDLVRWEKDRKAGRRWTNSGEHEKKDFEAKKH